MATKIKDSATAERAALKLNEGIEAPKTGEPNAPKEKSTSEKLFPEFITDDGAVVNRPIRNLNQSPEPPPAPATSTTVPQGQTPPTAPPTAPVYLKLDELTGKMVKLKVDGIEQDVPASDLIKLTQLERHSNAQLMKLAQERAQLERDRAEFLARPPAPEVKQPKKEPDVKKLPEVEALEAQIKAMQDAMAQERALLMPQIQEAGIKRVEQMAKDRLGTDDFRSYFDRIRESALAEASKPEVANNPQARAFFDSDSFYFQKYQELKLKDLVSKPATSSVPTNPNAPVLVTPQGAPLVINNSGQPVSMPSFESSSGVPSRTSESSDWQSTYNTLLTRAQQQPTDENWMNLMRHKFKRNE